MKEGGEGIFWEGGLKKRGRKGLVGKGREKGREKGRRKEKEKGKGKGKGKGKEKEKEKERKKITQQKK